MGYSLLLILGDGPDDLVANGGIASYPIPVSLNLDLQAVEVEKEARQLPVPFRPFL